MKSRRRLILTSLTALSLLAPLAAVRAQTAAADKPHKVVLQVSDADPAKWNLALNNARALHQDLGADKVAVEIVAYGPGIGILKMDSVVGARIADAMVSGTAVVACENTMRAQELTRDDMLPKIGYVPAGVVELMERQKQGYAYVRP